MRLTPKIVESVRYEGRSYTSKSGRKRWSRHVIWDDRLRGLGLRVSPKNHKSFFVSYQAEGKKRTKTLGSTDELTLKKARLLAAELLQSVAEVPAEAETVELSGSESVAALADVYLEKHLKVTSPSWFTDQRLLRQHILPALGRSPVAGVSPTDLVSLGSRISRRFPADAVRLRSLLKGLFDWAEEQGLWDRSAGAARVAEARRAAAGADFGEIPQGDDQAETAAASSPTEAAAGSPAEEERAAQSRKKSPGKRSPKTARKGAPKLAAAELHRRLEESEAERRKLAARLEEISGTGVEMLAKLNRQATEHSELEGELRRVRRALQKAESKIAAGPDAGKIARQTANLQQSVEQLMESLKKAQGERDELARQLTTAETRAGEQAKQVSLLVQDRNELEAKMREEERKAAIRRVQQRTTETRGPLAVRVAAAAIGGALLALLLQGLFGRDETLPSSSPALSDPEQTAAAVEAVPASIPQQAPAGSAPATGPGVLAAEPADLAPEPDLSAAEASVRAWAAAWAAQSVEDYLAAYSTRFRPPDGLSREDWAALRRTRLLRPSSIQVSIEGLSQAVIESDRVRVVFEQSYRTPTYSDRVFKTLELIWEEGAWKILSERSG